MKNDQVFQNALLAVALCGLGFFGASRSQAQDANTEVSLFPSPTWQVLDIHDLVCVSGTCDGKIGAIIANVTLEGDAQAIQISPDHMNVRTAVGESVALDGIVLMKIPNSAKASIRGLMTNLTVKLGEIQLAGNEYGFRYDGNFSESLISGGMTIGSNGPAPSRGSQVIIELLPVDSPAWLDHENLPLSRVRLSRENETEVDSALIFLMSPDVGEGMLLAGPKGDTVTVALLFTGNHEDFELLEFSETESLKLRPGAFSRFLKSVSDWWSE